MSLGESFMAAVWPRIIGCTGSTCPSCDGAGETPLTKVTCPACLGQGLVVLDENLTTAHMMLLSSFVGGALAHLENDRPWEAEELLRYVRAYLVKKAMEAAENMGPEEAGAAFAAFVRGEPVPEADDSQEATASGSALSAEELAALGLTEASE